MVIGFCILPYISHNYPIIALQEVNKMEGKPEIKEEKNRKATMEDVEAFAKVVGVSTRGCSYNTFTIALVHFINNLMNHPLASKSVNLECLKILVGEPISTLQELETVWKKHADLLKAENKRKQYAENEQAKLRDELRKLKRKMKDFVERDLDNTIMATGMRNELSAIARGRDTEGSFINNLMDAAHITFNKYQEFLSEVDN